MNEFSITPFRGLHLLLLLLTAAAVLLIFLLLRGKPEARRSRFLIGVCFFNLALFAGYKLSLSMDAAYVRAYLSVVVLHFGRHYPGPCKMNKCFEAGVWGAEPRKANSGRRARAGGSS